MLLLAAQYVCKMASPLKVVGLSVQMAPETLTDLHHLGSGGEMDRALYSQCMKWTRRCIVWEKQQQIIDSNTGSH